MFFHAHRNHDSPALELMVYWFKTGNHAFEIASVFYDYKRPPKKLSVCQEVNTPADPSYYSRNPEERGEDFKNAHQQYHTGNSKDHHRNTLRQICFSKSIFSPLDGKNITSISLFVIELLLIRIVLILFKFVSTSNIVVILMQHFFLFLPMLSLMQKLHHIWISFGRLSS